MTAIEVQTIDTTGSYSKARAVLAEQRSIISDTVGLNWENVSKRIIPQLIYKGQVLQREDLCKCGLYFVSPYPVHKRVIDRLGGKEKLPVFPSQPAAIHFLAYDTKANNTDGKITELDIIEQHGTTVYKIQEELSSLKLPDENVYKEASWRSLCPEKSK